MSVVGAGRRVVSVGWGRYSPLGLLYFSAVRRPSADVVSRMHARDDCWTLPQSLVTVQTPWRASHWSPGFVCVSLTWT